ncbi:MAG TPA: hypothetical protein VMX55_02660 [candidate division Zixibacteria bacterium]|nr:hypothetical protein [candidate division Zixibacteria bacterium]
MKAEQLKNYIFLIILMLSTLAYLPIYQHSDLSTSADLKILDQIEEKNLNTRNLLNSSSVWGDPLKLTSRDLSRGEYITSQDIEGIFHCIWLQEYTKIGIGLSYAHSIDDTGKTWSNSTLILRTDAEIVENKMVLDENKTIYLFYITKRVLQYHLFLTYKLQNNETWSNQKLLFYQENIVLKNLVLNIVNNKTTHVLFSSTDMNSLADEEENNKISYCSIKGINSFDSLNFRIMKSSSNQLVSSIISLPNGSLEIFYSLWNSEISKSNLFLIKSNDNGNSWSLEYEILTFNNEMNKLFLFPARTSNKIHIIGEINEQLKKVYYLELIDGLITELPVLVGYPNLESLFGGFIIDKVNDDIFIFFENRANTKLDIKFIKRINITKEWTEIEEITNDMSSYSPLFIGNDYNQSKNYGVLFYLGKNMLKSTTLLHDLNWSTPTTIFYSTTFNNEPSIAVNSKGDMHLVWTHTAIGKQEIRYMTKGEDNNWYFEFNLTRKWWSVANNPKLVFDSNDNLHCVFIAKESTTNRYTIFYRYLLDSQRNWSDPILVKYPEGYANQIPLECIVDTEDTLHIFWLEQTIFSTNRLIHSSKKVLEESFSSIVVQNNEEFIESSFPNAIIDSQGTIHLVYSDFEGEEIVNKIQYRYLTKGGTWSDSETIDATNVDYLFEPLLIVDTNDKITLTYLRKYIIGFHKWAADVKIWEKMTPDENWMQKNPIIMYELINYHNIFILPNNTICYLYHSDYLSIEGIPGNINDHVYLMSKSEGGGWSDKELLFLNPYFDAQPLGIYDQVSNNLNFIILDKIGSYPQLNWIMGQKDTDNDNLGDLSEEIYHSNPEIKDSDFDRLDDGYEVFISNTDPLLADTDFDDINDGNEILKYHTNPLDRDSDNDKLSDGDEVYIWRTNPNSLDSDQDSIYDFDEIFIYHTNPNSKDSDSDFMPDKWEIDNNLNPLIDDSFLDFDYDNLINVDEYYYNSDPNRNDTDFDGLLDGKEVHLYHTDPTAQDTDLDTLTDAEEILVFHTNPLLADSDKDGFTDREEINSGTDPNNPRDNIALRKLRKILSVILIPLGIILVGFLFFEIRFKLLKKQQEEQEKDEQLIQEQKLNEVLNKKKLK